MIQDLIREQNRQQRRLDNLVLPETNPDVISPFLAIPGLVGFWPMSSVQRSTGNAYDLSGQGRTLTYNGNPTYNYYNDIVPYIALDGTGDYLSRSDETDLDILGTETIYNSSVRGVTIGGWFWFDSHSGSSESMITKWGDATLSTLSYALYEPAATSNARFIVGDTVTSNAATSTLGLTTSAWHFCVGRFIPLTEVAVFQNGQVFRNTTSIISNIFNSSAPLSIGAIGAGLLLMTGRASLCFLSANALSDALINSLFQQTRVRFGV